MELRELSTRAEYQQLLGQIAHDYQQGQVRAVQAVNTYLLAFQISATVSHFLTWSHVVATLAARMEAYVKKMRMLWT